MHAHADVHGHLRRGRVRDLGRRGGSLMVDWTASAQAIEAAAPDIAVVAASSIEQHGAHLPLCTDHLIATVLSRLVAERLDAYLLPALPDSAQPMAHAPVGGSPRERGGRAHTTVLERMEPPHLHATTAPTQ